MAPTVVVLGVFALLGGAGFFHVLVVMTPLWWLLTRTGSRGRHAATYAAPVQAPPMRRSPVPPVSDAAYWPVLPAAAGAAAAWYATRETDQEPVVAAGDECEDDCADGLDTAGGGWHEPVEETTAHFGGSGGGGAWADATDDLGGSGGGGAWGDDFGGTGGGGDWGDDFGGYGGGGGWDDD